MQLVSQRDHNKKSIQQTCSQNHILIGRFNLNQCIMCDILKDLRKIDPNCNAVSNKVILTQEKFEFKCLNGHLFLADITNAKKGCPGCYLYYGLCKNNFNNNGIVSIDIDFKNVIVDYNTKIRMHCNKFKHDPKCQDTSETCKNYIRCDQDFYATISQLKSSKNPFNCNDNHTWLKNWEIIKSMCLLELYYGVRFDDNLRYENLFVEVSGYNKLFKIAFTHMNDRIPAKKVKIAQFICEQMEVKFIVIPAEITKASKLATYIFTSLNNLGELHENVDGIINKIRAKMRLRSANNKLFVNAIE